MQARIVPVPRYGRLEGDPATASSAEGQVATVGDQEEDNASQYAKTHGREPSADGGENGYYRLSGQGLQLALSRGVDLHRRQSTKCLVI